VATIPVTRRFDLTDAQWAVLGPLLPRGKKAGRPPKWTKRQLIDGIRWRVRVGAPWRDVPVLCEPWQTVYGLFRRWQRDGTWRRILTGLPARADAEGLITWDVSVDSTVSRAHQHAAGARTQPQMQKEPPGGAGVEPADHALGRSRGGLTTKLHLSCEQGQKPLSMLLTGGQRGDSPQFILCWKGSGPRAWVVAGPVLDLSGSWPMRPTPRTLTATTCVDAGSRPLFRSRPTRPRTAVGRGRRADDRRPSTPTYTSVATPWSVVSTGSNATAAWPPDTTSSPSATRPLSLSRRSTNG
jgi:transposase